MNHRRFYSLHHLESIDSDVSINYPSGWKLKFTTTITEQQRSLFFLSKWQIYFLLFTNPQDWLQEWDGSCSIVHLSLHIRTNVSVHFSHEYFYGPLNWNGRTLSLKTTFTSAWEMSIAVRDEIIRVVSFKSSSSLNLYKSASVSSEKKSKRSCSFSNWKSIGRHQSITIIPNPSPPHGLT